MKLLHRQSFSLCSSGDGKGSLRLKQYSALDAASSRHKLCYVVLSSCYWQASQEIEVKLFCRSDLDLYIPYVEALVLRIAIVEVIRVMYILVNVSLRVYYGNYCMWSRGYYSTRRSRVHAVLESRFKKIYKYRKTYYVEALVLRITIFEWITVMYIIYGASYMVLCSSLFVSPTQPSSPFLLDVSRDGDIGTVRKLVSAGVNTDLQTEVQYLHVEVHSKELNPSDAVHYVARDCEKTCQCWCECRSADTGTILTCGGASFPAVWRYCMLSIKREIPLHAEVHRCTLVFVLISMSAATWVCMLFLTLTNFVTNWIWCQHKYIHNQSGDFTS